MSTAIQRLTLRLTKLETILTAILFFTPVILILSNGGVILQSISAYAYSSSNYIFAFLLSIAASMFVYNGSLYNKNFYNIILGCALAGVVLTPHLNYPIAHAIFAAIFFIGSIITMNVYAKKNLLISITASLLIVVGLLGHFVFGWYSLFFAEWIGLIPISLHFIFKK